MIEIFLKVAIWIFVIIPFAPITVPLLLILKKMGFLSEILTLKRTEEREIISDYTNCYQPTYILTKNEYHAYKKLREITDKNELLICPKVRLLDIVRPRDNINNITALRKIQSKHVDFVITNKDLYVKAILELDDNSHEDPERQERDIFVDNVLTNCGYKIIRTKYINDDILDCILQSKS